MTYPDDNREAILAEIMSPENANFGGNIHGGYLLSLLDRVAYTCAARYTRQYVVTLSVDHVTFKKPVHVGELVTFLACVNYVGRSSLEIGIKVIAENLTTGEKRHTISCFFTMVALDAQHKPVQVTPLEIRNATEKRRFEEAKLRREMKMQFIEEHETRKRALRERF